MRPYLNSFLMFAGGLGILSIATAAPDDEIVFKSDVSLVRIDAQVLDRDGRAITGMLKSDFVILESNKPQPIRNFAAESMPVDVLFLLDVSASMRPHVQRLATAAHDAIRVLGPDDRVGIMVFDRATRVRMEYRSDRSAIDREFEAVLKHERFNGGTDITRGLLDAADYVRRSARRDARRAIVILTDDQTEFDRNEAQVERALTRADAVLSALIAPNAMDYRQQRQGGGYPGGGGYPRGGGRPRIGMGIPGIGLPIPGGGGGGYPRGGGGGYPGGGSRTKSAGTSEIARESGGDSMSVDDGSALETTLSRIRQKYALHFQLPEGVRAGDERNIEVQLSAAARRMYPDAEVRYRRVYLAPGGGGSSTGPVEVSRAPSNSGRRSADDDSDRNPAGGFPRDRSTSSTSSTYDMDADRPSIRRRPNVSEPGSARGPIGAAQPAPAPAAESADSNAAARSQPAPAPADAPAAEAPKQGGWRKAKPGEQD